MFEETEIEKPSQKMCLSLLSQWIGSEPRVVVSLFLPSKVLERTMRQPSSADKTYDRSLSKFVYHHNLNISVVLICPLKEVVFVRIDQNKLI